MSYDLRIWEHPQGQPEPKTIDDAARVMLALENKKTGINPKFNEFAKRLTVKYPSRNMFPAGDRDANDAVWVGDPVKEAREHSEAVYAISLPSDDRARIMHFVVDTANALGLTVFDDQIGWVFLPDGRVLPEENTGKWKELRSALDAPSDAMTKPQLRKRLVVGLTSILKPLGFHYENIERHDAVFVRKFDGGNQRIDVFIKGDAPEFGCSIWFSTKHDAVTRVNDVVDKGGGAGENSLSIPLREFFAKDYDWIYPLHNAMEVQSLFLFLEKKVLPILEKCRTLEGIDAFVNKGEPYPPVVQMKLGPLIAAWEVGNPDFDALAERFLKMHDKPSAPLRELSKRFVTYLRENSPPRV